MSISHALSNALSGLTAASRGAEVVAANVANANTEGYGRRRLDLTSQQVGGRGAGVQIDGITRIVDRNILSERRLAEATLSRDDRLAGALRQLEALYGGVGSEMGLEARLTALEQALVSSSSDPASEVRLRSVLDRLGDLSDSLNSASDGIQQMRLDAEEQIASDVDLLNRSLQQVQLLNSDISRMLNIGQDPSGLMDQRQKVIDTISNIVPVREMRRDGGLVALMTTSGQMLIDGPAAEIGFERRNSITPDMTLTSGGLVGLTIYGNPVVGSTGAGRLSGGSLGAAFALRDELLVDAQTELDNIAADLALRFQDSTVDPTVVAGAPGLLTDAGAEVDPSDIVGLSARIAVNAAVDPDTGGDLWRLRDGVAATAQGPAGRSDQLVAWSDALSALRADTSGVSRSAAGHVGVLVTSLASDRLSADDDVAFATARWETVRQAQLADGVDTDYEMQMLLRIEESYSANARVMETINVLMRELLEI